MRHHWIGKLVHSDSRDRLGGGRSTYSFPVVTNRMRTEFRAFEAHCESCGHRFLRPELGDTSYGEFIFATANPPYYVYCSAFDVGPQLIHDLLGDSTADCFQAALACFADSSAMVNSLKCLSCGQQSLLRLMDGAGHPIEIPTTTYFRILALARSALAVEIEKFKADWRSGLAC